MRRKHKRLLSLITATMLFAGNTAQIVGATDLTLTKDDSPHNIPVAATVESSYQVTLPAIVDLQKQNDDRFVYDERFKEDGVFEVLKDTVELKVNNLNIPENKTLNIDINNREDFDFFFEQVDYSGNSYPQVYRMVDMLSNGSDSLTVDIWPFYSTDDGIVLGDKGPECFYGNINDNKVMAFNFRGFPINLGTYGKTNDSIRSDTFDMYGFVNSSGEIESKSIESSYTGYYVTTSSYDHDNEPLITLCGTISNSYPVYLSQDMSWDAIPVGYDAANNKQKDYSYFFKKSSFAVDLDFYAVFDDPYDDYYGNPSDRYSVKDLLAGAYTGTLQFTWNIEDNQYWTADHSATP